MKLPDPRMTTLAVTASLALGCSNGGPAGSSQAGGSIAASAASAPGAVAVGPGTQVFRPFLHDPNQRGVAASVILADASWGRLVEVFDFDAATQLRTLIYSDFVVGAAVVSDGVDYELGENLAGQAELTILHRRGTAGFRNALAVAEAATQPIADATLPPWSVVPRNAAISLRFDDLLDEATVDLSTVKLFTGTPRSVPFDARIFADQNHGSVADPDGDGAFEFYPTRVIADLTVSALEAQNSPFPLSINTLGLPASQSTSQANVQLKLPTTIFPPVGQLKVLANPVGNGLDLAGNGSIDLASPTQDVLRAFRSGGRTSITGDHHNGFLQDGDAPSVVAELSLAITGSVQADPLVEDGYRISSATFNNAACATLPQAGDLLRQGASTAVVYDVGFLNGAVLNDLDVRVLSGAAPMSGLGQLSARYAPPISNEQCFVSYLPLPILPPNRGVSPTAQVRIRFSEPMEAGTIGPLDSFTISSTSGTPGSQDTIVGDVLPDSELAGYTFLPSMPLPHQAGNNETYHVRVGAHNAVPTDLAGNTLAAPLSAANFQVDPNAPTELSGNLALRFDSTDMVGGDGLTEFRGQFSYELPLERLAPRSLVHFSADVDRSQTIPAVMTPFQPGVQTPLSPLGSKLQNVWRYADIGFSLTDEANTNLDVEGLSWAPIGGQVIADTYSEFSIQLGHAQALPDEFLDPMTLFPKYPTSGLGTTYAQNYADTPSLVHERTLGYVVNPADLYVAASGTAMMPFPLNRDVPPAERAYCVWRDTALSVLGGAGGSGAPFDQEILVDGLPNVKTYAAGSVPSIGLPLLMEYRCFPEDNALGLNAFDISLAANSSARPNFRAYSTGGFNSSGSPVLVDPAQNDVATGGFAPGTGQNTQPVDNVFYMGSVDFVTRTSRAHTIWFDTATTNPIHAVPSILAELPPGTSVSLAFRGATSIAGGTPATAGYIGADALGLDAYGDPIDPLSNGDPVFLNMDPSWFADISQINGARYLQLRVTFEGEPVSGATPRLTGLGLAWTD